MSIQELITWLGNCPVLQGETINWNYLPSYSGWSLTIPKAEIRTDIPHPKNTIYTRCIKRVLDVVLSGTAIVVLSPVLLVLMLLELINC